MKSTYKINDERKIELSLGKSTYQALPNELQRDIKSYFLFSRSREAWVSKGQHGNYAVNRILDEIRKHTELEFEGKDERVSFSELMERKADRAESRADRYEAKSEAAEKRAESLQAEFNRLRKDFSWLTQPIIRGHKGSERFGRQKEQVMNRYEKGFEEYQKSAYYQEKKASSGQLQRNLQDPYFVARRIQDAHKLREKWEKAIEAATAKMESKALADGREWTEETQERYEKWLKNALDQLQECYEKLAFYIAIQEESGHVTYTQETLKNAQYIKNRGRWYKVIRVNKTTVTHSWFVGEFKHSYADIEDAVFPGDTYKLIETGKGYDYIITDIIRGNN